MPFKSLVSLFAIALFCLPLRAQSPSEILPIDMSFGNGGIVATSFGLGIPGYASAVVIQADGKIVTAGRAGVKCALARHNSDGSLDSSFGVGGKVITVVFGCGDQAFAILLQPDGKIVVGGISGRGCENWEFVLARYNSDGSLDSSFGVEGIVTTGFVGQLAGARSIVLLPDGKIVAAGASIPKNGLDPTSDFALVRYNPDGTLDASFGVEGRVTTDFFGADDRANAVVVQPNRKIVAMGSARRKGEYPGIFAAARYNADGSLDTTFGTNGRMSSDFAGHKGEVYAGLLQPDGRIVLAGYVALRTTPYETILDEDDFGLMRLNPDGSLDSTFGEGGKVTIDFFNNTNYAAAIALQRNGKIVIGGYVGGDLADFAIARVNSNGAIDKSFGDAGKLTMDFFHFGDSVQALAIQDDGRIVAAGAANVGAGEEDFVLARFDSSRPIIAGATTSGKRLIISGSGFEDDAIVLINGKEQKTINDKQNSAARLISKKAGKKLRIGDRIRVLNSDGALSPEFEFTG